MKKGYSRWLQAAVITCTVITIGVIASQVLAGGTKCLTALNLGTSAVQCSGQTCIGAPAGTCVSHTFNGFMRSVTRYTVVWNNGKATVTVLDTIAAPGPAGAKVTTCACKIEDEEGGTVTYGDSWCCDAVYASKDGGTTWKPGTMGSCQDDGCTNPKPNCTLTVEANGYMAEAICK